MKKELRRLWSFIMTFAMVMECIAPGVVVAGKYNDDDKLQLIHTYKIDDNDAFSYLIPAIEDGGESKSDMRLALTAKSEQKNIKLAVRNDFALYDTAYYKSLDEISKVYNKVIDYYASQGLDIKISIVENEDGTYNIQNDFDKEKFLENLDGEKDSTEVIEEDNQSSDNEDTKNSLYNDNYTIYEFEVKDDFDFDQKGLQNKIKDYYNEERVYIFDFTILNNKNISKSDVSKTVEIVNDIDIVGAILDDTTYTYYNTDRLEEEIPEVKKHYEELSKKKAEEEAKKAEEEEKESETEVITEETSNNDLSKDNSNDKEDSTQKEDKKESSKDNKQDKDSKEDSQDKNKPDKLEIGDELVDKALGASPSIVNGKNFELKTTLKINTSINPIPQGWTVVIDLGPYLKEDPKNTIKPLQYNGNGRQIATGTYADHKITYTFNRITQNMDLTIDQILAFDIDNIKKYYGENPEKIDINITVTPKNMSVQKMPTITVTKNSPNPVTSEFVVGGKDGINSVTYPYKLEVSSSQKLKDKNGNQVEFIPTIVSDPYQVWWDFEVDTTPLKAEDVDFDSLKINLYGSNQQGLDHFEYKVATNKQDLDINNGYIRNNTTGPELMTAFKSIPKKQLGDKLYIRVKALTKVGEYHDTYSIGLRINPSSNYIKNILDKTLEQFNSIPLIFKWIRGLDVANKWATTPFNLVDSMYTAQVGLISQKYTENFYYDSSRTIVAKRNTDIDNEWYALDLLRIGETPDIGLRNASLNPSSDLEIMYFVPNVSGGYTRTASESLAKISNEEYKPGTIVSYKYFNQRGKKETNYKLSANLKEKNVDFIDTVEENQNAKTEGGLVNLFSKVFSKEQVKKGYLAYIENPYYIMRIDKTFEMVECFNAFKYDPTLVNKPKGIYLQQHKDPSGDYLLTRLNKTSKLESKLTPGSQLNPKGLSKGDALEDLIKRIYFYANEEKKEYSKLNNGKVMHRQIEDGMKQKVIHFYTDQRDITDDFFPEVTGNNWNDPRLMRNITLVGGVKPGSTQYDPAQYFDGEKKNNNWSQDSTYGSARKLSPNENPLPQSPIYKVDQDKYAKKLLDRVEASYNNNDWTKDKANSVRLVFYSHTENLQELITAHITEPISIEKVNEQGEKVEGAEFTIINKQTGESTIWSSKSSNNTDNKLYLKEGTYYVKETKAPEKYELLSPFTIKVSRQEVNPDDGPYPKYELLKGEKAVHVNDGYNTILELGNDIPKKANGNPYVEIINENSGNKEIQIKITDPSNILGKIKFTKKSEDYETTDINLDGAEFRLTKIKSKTDFSTDLGSDGSNVYQRTSDGKNGVFEFNQMPEGYYLLEETKVPIGYEKTTNKIIEVKNPTDGTKRLVAKFLNIDNDDSLKKTGDEYSIINKTKKTEIRFKKVDETENDTEGKEPLIGAKFELNSIKNINGISYDKIAITSKKKEDKGIFKFTDIAVGEYVLKELVAPTGYQRPQDLEGEDKFFGWKLVVYQEEGKDELSYKIYKLKTSEQALGSVDGLEEITPADILKPAEITNKKRTIEAQFQKYIENPDFNPDIAESETNKKYIPIDTNKLTNTDGKKVSFDLYNADYYGAKRGDKIAVIEPDKNGIFHLKGLKFNGYYILEESNPPDGYQKSNAILLRVVAEALANEGEMKVIVRDPNINSYMIVGDTFAGVINFKKDEYSGKFSIKKTGDSLDKEHPGEVGLRRAYFRLYYADGGFNKKLNDKGYPEFIQKVSPGIPITEVDEEGKQIIDEKGNPIPIDVTKLPPDQGIVTFDQLKTGNYILEEYRGPAGYEKDPNPWYIQVQSDGTVVKSRIKDDPNFSNGSRNSSANPASIIDIRSLSVKSIPKENKNLAFSPSYLRARSLGTGDTEITGRIAKISVEGSNANTINGTKDVTVKIFPKTETTNTEPRKLHMILLWDRAKYQYGDYEDNYFGKLGGYPDDNINKFLTDINKKAQETNTDVDISLIKYSYDTNHTEYKGTFNLNEMNANKNLEHYNYYDRQIVNGNIVTGNVEQVNSYLHYMDPTDKAEDRPYDGSKNLNTKLDGFLTSIENDTKNKIYDQKIAVNFARFDPINPNRTGDNFYIVNNMEKINGKGYETWTTHIDHKSRGSNIIRENYKKKALNSSNGNHYAFYFNESNSRSLESNSYFSPYFQRDYLNENIINNTSYFKKRKVETDTKLKNATFEILLNNSLSKLNADGWKVTKYNLKGKQIDLPSDTTVTKEGHRLFINNLTLGVDEYLVIKYQAKVPKSLNENLSLKIHKSIILNKNKDTQVMVNSPLTVDKEKQGAIIGKPTGKASINIKFHYNNYPDKTIPQEGIPGTVKLQAKFADGDWRDLGKYNNQTGQIEGLISEKAPFDGEVNFTELGKDYQYRIVYTRNAPYYDQWEEPQISYYPVTFEKSDKGLIPDDATATVDISNGNLLRIYNRDEEGFRIPLRITKINDDNMVLTGAQFRARKITDGTGKDADNNLPKYSNEGFDAVTEATGLAGDNYLRELTPGIYEIWEIQEPNGYKHLTDRWYFEVKVDPNKHPNQQNYMTINFNFSHNFANDIDDPSYNKEFRDFYKTIATAEEKKIINDNILGKTVYGLGFDNNGGTGNLKPGDYDGFIQNIEIVEDDGRSHPARPDAPYQKIDNVNVINHKASIEFKFNKTDNNNNNIADAEFRLTKINVDKDGNPILVTGKDGNKHLDIELTDAKTPTYSKYSKSTISEGVSFKEVIQGTYALEEIVAAPGYKKIDGYLIIKFQEDNNGKLIQKLDLNNSTDDFKALITKITDDNGYSSLVSIKNKDNTIDLKFNKVDTKGQVLRATGFSLYRIDRVGENEEETKLSETTNYGSNEFKFNGLKEGRYKLVEYKTIEGYEVPTPWFFNVEEIKDSTGSSTGKLQIVFDKLQNPQGEIDKNGDISVDTELVDDQSVIKNEDGSFTIKNYKTTNFKFTKFLRNPEENNPIISDIYFNLRKVRTKVETNGKQIYDDGGNIVSGLEKYKYEAKDISSDRFGIVMFEGLSEGVYELTENQDIIPDFINKNTQNKWIIKVIKEGDALKVEYDKKFEKAYFSKNDRAYYKIYISKNFDKVNLFEKDGDKLKLANLPSGMDFKFKKLDKDYDTTIKDLIDFGLYKLSDDPSNENLENIDLSSYGSEVNIYAKDGIYEAQGLKEGLYKLEEKKAPEGYDKADRQILLQVIQKGKLNPNEPDETKGDLTIKFYEIKDREDGSGKELLRDPQEFKYLKVENGQISIDTEGYYGFNNKPTEKRGAFKINKVDNNKKKLQGARFELVDGNNKKIMEVDSDKDGVASFINVPQGSYTLREIVAPEGYEGTNTTWEIVVDENGTTTIDGNPAQNGKVSEITVTNNEFNDKYGKFEITKTDNNKEILPGAEFTLTPTNGTEGEKVIQASDDKGKVEFVNLKPGTYRLEETKAPEGYKGTDTTWIVTVDVNGVTKVEESTAKANIANFLRRFNPMNLFARSIELDTNTSIDQDSLLKDATFGKSTVSTSVTDLNNGKFQVDLDITAGEGVPEKADLVILLPSKYIGQKEKNAIIQLLDKYTDTNNGSDNIKVGLNIYNVNNNYKLSSGGLKTPDEIKTLLNSYNKFGGGGYDIPQTGVAFKVASDWLLNSGRADTKKEILHITGGGIMSNYKGIQDPIKAVNSKYPGKFKIHNFLIGQAEYSQGMWDGTLSPFGSGINTTSKKSGSYSEADYLRDFPKYVQNDIDNAIVDISFNDDFNFVTGSTNSYKDKAGQGRWHKQYNNKRIELLPNELTLDTNHTAHISFKLEPNGKLPKGTYKLINDITFDTNSNSEGNKILAPQVIVSPIIEKINVTVQSKHDNTVPAGSSIDFTLKRKFNNQVDTMFEETGTISLGNSHTFENLPKTDENGNEYTYFLSEVTKSGQNTDKFNIESYNGTVSLKDGIIEINSTNIQLKDFVINVNWHNLDPKGKIHVTLSNGKTLDLTEAYSSKDYDPDSVTITGVSFTGFDGYKATLTGDKSPYTIDVSEKSKFSINLAWNNIQPVEDIEVTATLTGGKEIKLNSKNSSYEQYIGQEGITANTKIEKVSINNKGYNAYYNNASPYTITISKKDKQNINVINTKNPRGYFTIRKIDDGNNPKVLPGAKFVLKDEAGKVVGEPIISGEDGLVQFKDLLPGDYTLEETEAPNGYNKSNNTWSIKIKEDGNTIIKEVIENGTTNTEKDVDLTGNNNQFDITNKEKKKTFFKIHKKDGLLLSKPIPNVEFKLTPINESNEAIAGENPITATTNKNGDLEFTNIYDGRYKLEEINHPDGYYDILIDFIVVVKDGKLSYTRKLKDIVNTDKNARYASAGPTNEVLYNVEFLPKTEKLPDNITMELYKKTANGSQYLQNYKITSDNFNGYLNGLDTGNYYVKLNLGDKSKDYEVSYVKLGLNKIQVIVYKKGAFESIDKNTPIEIRNFPEQKGEGKFTLNKKDSVSEDPLSGVVFNVKGSNGYNKDFTTDSGGKIHVTGLPNGEYWVQEKTQKDGYVLNPNPIKVMIGDEWEVPDVEGKDVSEYFSIDTNSSSLTSTSGSENIVYPNMAEGLIANMHYTIDESVKIKPGDTFTLKLSDNVDIDGIAHLNDRSFDIYGPMGRFAVAKIRDDRKTIDYTFTTALAEYDKITNLTINTPMFVNRYLIPFDNTVNITTQIGEGSNAVYTKTINVNYDNTNNNGYIKNKANVKAYMLKFNPPTGEFTTVIYVNPWRKYDSQRSIDFFTNVNSTIKELNVYMTTDRSPNKLPWSFATDYKDINNPYKLRTLKEDKNLNYDVNNNIPLHINLGKSNVRGNQQFVIEIKGVSKEKRDFKTITRYYRNSKYLKFKDRDFYDYGWDEWSTWCQFFTPGGSSDAQRVVYNSKNKIEYTKMSGKLVATTNTDQDYSVAPDKALQGVRFELRKKDAKGEFVRVYDSTRESDQEGKFSWQGLGKGEYQVWEIKSTDGYAKPKDYVSSFKVDSVGNIIDVENNSLIIINHKPTDFEIIKKDFDDEKALQGAQFSLYKQVAGFDNPDVKFNKKEDENFKLVTIGDTNIWTTDKDGRILFKSIEDGTYYIKEEKAPDGYINKSDAIGPIVIKDGIVQISQEDGKKPTKADDKYELKVIPKDENHTNSRTTSQMTVYNTKVNIPLTGGRGTLLIVIIGVALMSIGITLYERKKRKLS